MINEKDALVQFKYRMLEKGFPAKDAIVFGDMYIVEGGYARKCLDLGCESALLVDSLETPNWLDMRKENPRLNFYKGDFSNTLFMKSILETYDIGVVFDILLHQAPLLNTLHLMLEKIKKRICIVQPMLVEQKLPNSLVYLPGNPETARLYPLEKNSADYKAFDVYQVNQSHWLWGMTVSFLTSVLKGEGFEVTYSEKLSDLPNKNWIWWGCVAERKHKNETHWSRHTTTRDLYIPKDW